jgi:hypothetical protein
VTTHFFCRGLPRHHCLSEDHRPLLHDGPVDDNLDQDLWTAIRRTPWNYPNDKIQVQEAFNAARQVVLICGRDPSITSVSHMDELDARVASAVFLDVL